MSLLWLIPDSLIPIAVVVLAFAVMFGFMSWGVALLTLVALALAPVIIDPLIDLAFTVLPWWMLLLLGAAVLMSVVRIVASIVLGGRASDHVLGHLVAFGLIGLLQLLFLPVRLDGLLLMRLFTLR